jgi:hypothetical protein
LEGPYQKGFLWGRNQRLLRKLFGTLLKNIIFGTTRLFCLVHKLERMKFCNFKNMNLLLLNIVIIPPMITKISWDKNLVVFNIENLFPNQIT